MLLGMAQMFVPSMADLTVTKNADPVPLPLAGLPVPEGIENPHITIAERGLGISLGEGSQTGLHGFMQNNGSDTGTIFAFGWDFGFYMEQIAKQLTQHAGRSIDGMVEPNTMKMYVDLIDRQYSEIRITEKGVEASQVIPFK